MELTHGGDIYSYQLRHNGQTPLDLSANINPFGIPESVRQAMHEAIDRCDRYPDPMCRALRQAIADSEGIDPEWIYCGNGAADIIYRLAKVLHAGRILVTAPTFAEYELAAGQAEVRAHMLRAENGFQLTAAILEDMADTDAVYLCNPNNPTGALIDPALLKEIADTCERENRWLIVDECFLDFMQKSHTHSLKPLLGSHKHLIILRAYTKMFAVPGVRIGYMMHGNAEKNQELYAIGQPWNVSVIAQACGIAAAKERDFAARTAEMIRIEREYMTDRLRQLGLTVYDSAANFLLWRSGDAELGRRIAAQGVLVRDCSNYAGLTKGDYRSAVRMRDENDRLLQVLKEVM